MAAIACVRPVEAEPAILRDVFFCDCNEYRSSRLGRQQVVKIGLQFLGLGVEAHREQQPLLVEQEGKVHGIRQVARLFACLPQVLDQTHSILPCLRQHRHETIHFPNSISFRLKGEVETSFEL